MDPAEALHQLGGIADLPSLLEFTSRRSLRTALSSSSVVRASTLPMNPARIMSKLATVIQCGRRLPFDQALAVADSALRNGDVSAGDLRAAAASVTGKGAPAIRRVATEANALAANPFESALRAVALDVPGLRVVPQHPIAMHDYVIHPDLVDVDRRIALEADSWIHHGSRAGHKSDCERYNFLVLDGWLLLRYVWEQVMLHPDQVRADLVQAVAARPLRRRSA